jgi:hypothetical protein
MKTTLFALSCLTLVACAMGYTPRMYYSYIEVLNRGADTISNLEVHIGADGRSLRCDTVTKNRICYERVGRRLYPRQTIELSWQDSAGKLQSRQLQPSLPLTLSPALPMRILLQINADSSVEVEFREDDFRVRASTM